MHSVGLRTASATSLTANVSAAVVAKQSFWSGSVHLPVGEEESREKSRKVSRRRVLCNFHYVEWRAGTGTRTLLACALENARHRFILLLLVHRHLE